MLKIAHIQSFSSFYAKLIFFGAGWFEMGTLGRKEEAGAMAFQVEKAK